MPYHAEIGNTQMRRVFEWPKPSGGDPLDQRSWFYEHARPGDRLFDCGAAAGCASAAFFEFCPDGQAICVEPNPVNVITIGEYGRDRIAIVQAALWDETGVLVPLYLDCVETDRTTIGSDPHEFPTPDRQPVDGQPRLWVSTVTLDDLAERFGLPSIVKLDVEGCELRAIRGGSHALRSARVVMMETRADLLGLQGAFPEDLHEALGDLGFTHREMGHWGKENDWCYWR